MIDIFVVTGIMKKKNSGILFGQSTSPRWLQLELKTLVSYKVRLSLLLLAHS